MQSDFVATAIRVGIVSGGLLLWGTELGRSLQERVIPAFVGGALFEVLWRAISRFLDR